MLIRRTPDHPIRSSEITSESDYENRRQFLKEAGLLGLGLAGVAAASRSAGAAAVTAQQGTSIGGAELKPELTPWEDVTTYNNFYEFGTSKEDPAENAKNFKTKPWTVKVEGLVAKPATYNVDDFLKPYKMEERIARHRCVEAWSMVIPWLGFPMADFVKQMQPLGSAKYVEFTTLLDPKQMPGQRSPVLQWPYVEALRLDEAMNPLAFLAVGVYGKMLPNQNGAPLRHVVPWKYGFKGCKSIVKIRFTDTMPRTAWNVSNPGEYGFFGNVNPEVDHPRWSQAKERRIGEFRKRDSLMFNGYAQQVASMYSGMDLRKLY
ncbi:MAG: protein-methionine-sulfoxide reductase catalytic subunit MsrP [Gemmatimonadetes bacterium]|nr:protein-methionine-sulfoxide reductase catalytic subunit MsrP [Gemmatimonadota bacterium]MCC6773697.1 protein-methionine-sulfoxide reductase catalytic subunit MsrP [Gemmatimonadaceae bacterium]